MSLYMCIWTAFSPRLVLLLDPPRPPWARDWLGIAWSSLAQAQERFTLFFSVCIELARGGFLGTYCVAGRIPSLVVISKLFETKLSRNALMMCHLGRLFEYIYSTDTCKLLSAHASGSILI